MPMTNEEIEVLKSSCIDRWRDSDFENNELDNRLIKVLDIFEKWFKQIPKDSQSTVKPLLENLKYYSRKNVTKKLQELHNRLIDNYNLNDIDTVYTSLEFETKEIKSSSIYVHEYCLVNNIPVKSCIPNISDIIKNKLLWSAKNNIVFIDDYVGTGGTVISHLRKYLDEYENKTIYLIVINLMEEARIAIDDWIVRKNAFRTMPNNIIFIPFDEDKKAFERNIFNDDNSAKEILEIMCDDFLMNREITLGYEDSQSLVAFYNNTPDNTLGFIQHDIAYGYSPIFPRTPLNVKVDLRKRMEEIRKNRRAMSYSNPSVSRLPKNQRIKYLLLIYFNTKKKNYDIQESIIFFGFTSHQMIVLLKQLADDGWIKHKDYLLSITEKGERILIGHDAFKIKYYDIVPELVCIDKSIVMPRDEPYVPKK